MTVEHEIAEKAEKAGDKEFEMVETLFSQSQFDDFIQSDCIQAAWHSSLETPNGPTQNQQFTTINKEQSEVDEFDFDVKFIVSPKAVQTDTTFIMRQLNLDEEEFDYFNSEIDFDNDPDIEIDIEHEPGNDIDFNDDIDDDLDISEIDPSVIASKCSSICSDDPLDLLCFPISQFPGDCFEKDEKAGDIICGDDDAVMEESDLNILLSEFDLLEPKKMCEDYDLSLDFNIPMTQMISTMPTAEKENDVNVDEHADIKVGFITGRGKPLPPPSDESMKNAKIKLMVVDEELENEINDCAAEKFPLFTTGRGKSIPPPSEAAMKKALSLIEKDVDDGSLNSFKSASFSTAKGKPLPPPSKAAIEKAKRLIDTVNEDYSVKENSSCSDNEVPIVVQFSNAKGVKLPSPSKEALKRAAKLVNEIDSLPVTAPQFVGFKSGKGHNLPAPSEEALKRAKKIIETEQEDVPSINRVGVTSVLDVPSVPSVRSDNNKKPKLTSTLTHTPLTNIAVKRPFSFSSAWKRPRRLNTTKNVMKPVVKVKEPPLKLFDLSTTGLQRYNFKEFFKQTPNLRIESFDYESFGISREILRINSKNAVDFKFSNNCWGVNEAYEALITCGANRVLIDLKWTINHYRWIVWKFASLIRTFPNSYSHVNLSPPWVLSQLLYRYEREIHQCHRSALKKIIERDDASGKYLCLMVSGVDWDNKRIELSDGWYSIWTIGLDPPLWNLIENFKLFEGKKIEISGATLTGQDPHPALEASSPECPCKMVIFRNSCRPSQWDTKLGFMASPKRPAVAFMKHLRHVHPQGGPIPAINCVIERVYPVQFREEQHRSSLEESDNCHTTTTTTTTTTNSIHTRNERDHYLYLEMHPEQAKNSKFTQIRRIRVTDSAAVSSALISFWNPLGEDQITLLTEGKSVIMTNLRTFTGKPGNFNTTTLSLVSSKSTRLFSNPEISTDTSLSTIKSISLQSSATKLKELKVNETVDLIDAIVLGKCGNYFWIGPPDHLTESISVFDHLPDDSLDDTMDSSVLDIIDDDIIHHDTIHDTIDSITDGTDLLLICLKNFSNTFNNLLTGDCVNFRDLSFNHFDSRENVLHFNFNDFSNFKKDSGRDFACKRAFERFKELTN